MKKTSKKISVILLSLALLTAQDAFAARAGKSRNLGMQRSTTTNTNSNSGYQPTSNTGSQTQQPARGGSKVGAAVAGVAAGALGGYMLGKAMNSHESGSSTTSQSNESTIPWGIIAILGILLAIGLMIFRRKAAPSVNPANMSNSVNNGNTNNFEIPNIRKDNANYTTNNQQSTSSSPAPAINPLTERMADGIEVQFFLRQAKGMFLHIQSMNTPENVSEIAKYMTPELYFEMKSLISENDYVADFSQLDMQYLQSTTENNQYIASVKFFGKVSESPTSPTVDFSEIWHFVKSLNVENAKWLVAGIQQVNSAN